MRSQPDMKKLVAKGAALMMTFLLFACATATPYQPNLPGQKVAGGYSQTRLTDDRYEVSFEGNTLTSRERVESYLLYRAAELTVQNGYDWFVLLDHETETERRTYIDRYPRYSRYGPYYDYWRPHWSYYAGSDWVIWHPYGPGRFWSYEVDSRTVEKFKVFAEIRMGKGTMPENGDRVFDARTVITDLEPTIERPEDN
ncbi:CC0125/CC1285 family lipoprotein [Parasphingorhabdus sp.]|uniref:CC0125/CC1285 family lipoprotein n=1 Tax=Parasphingorhabdus sp. TaxID=2709688 RepID=UPI003A915AAD